MAFLQINLLWVLLSLGMVHHVVTQMKNTAPETIQSCYKNITALNRGNRQPMHIQNLIAIIRKIEEKELHFRDMRRLARTIVKRFQFDGIYHDPDKTLDLQFSPHPLESIKNTIIHSLIPDNADILENNVLDNDERCALHWMVSHSLNATVRDDEAIERYQRQRYSGGLRAKRAAFGDGQRITNRPIETGTVYTDWGPVSAGRVFAGIAAGLMLESIPVTFKYDTAGAGGGVEPGSNYPPYGGNGGNGNNNPSYGNNNPSYGNNNPTYGNDNPSYGNNNPQYGKSPWQYGRKKRQVGTTFEPLQNIHAATLAGDVGQAAILNAPYIQRISGLTPPVGEWNDTICPREYILNALPDPTSDPSHAHDTWSFMTGAEIRGGMDGLVLASKARELSDKGFTLSQLLSMYYSTNGIYGDSSFRACDRVSVFPSVVDVNTVKEQSRSFAYHYNSMIQKVIVTEQSTNVFNGLVDQAFSKMMSFQSMIASDPPCLKRPPSSGSPLPDQDKEVKPMGYVYAVLDHSTKHEELVAQQRFVAKLATEFDVSPKGFRLGLVDGRNGQVLITPNYTDNAPILACRILKQPQGVQPTNLAQVLRTLKTELRRVRDEQERQKQVVEAGNKMIVLIFVQGKKLEESQRDRILDQLEEYDEEFGDVQVIYTSSKYRKQDFDNFMLHPDDANFIPIQPQNSGNLSDSSSAFLKEFLKRTHGQLKYGECNELKYPEQDDELQKGVDIWVKPNTIHYYMITPSSFYSSVDLRLRFSSDNGKVRVCVSKDDKFPINYSEQENDDRNIECEETSGTYQTSDSMQKDIEFIYTKPCSQRKREDCDPIYVSITPTEVPVASGAVGLDCSLLGCDTPDEVRVTWTHYDMRCNHASKLGSFSILLAVMSISLSLFGANILH